MIHVELTVFVFIIMTIDQHPTSVPLSSILPSSSSCSIGCLRIALSRSWRETGNEVFPVAPGYLN